MADGVGVREPTPVAEVWPERVLQRLVAAGRLTIDEVVDAAAPAARGQLAGDPCVPGGEVDVAAEVIAASWAEQLFGEDAVERLRSKATDRRRGETGLVLLRELVQERLLREGVVSGVVARVVEAYRMTPEDGEALIEGLFGVESAEGVCAVHEDVLARVS